jgi:hypothetical protein
VKRSCRKCGNLDVSEPYEPPRIVTGIASTFIQILENSLCLREITGKYAIRIVITREITGKYAIKCVIKHAHSWN